MEGAWEETALEALKGCELSHEEADYILQMLEAGIEHAALNGPADDGSGAEADSFQGTVFDTAASLPELEPLGQAADSHQHPPGFFTHLMLGAEPDDAVGDAWLQPAEGSPPLERSPSSASTATQAGGQRRTSKRARQARQPAEAPEAGRPARRPRRTYREGEPRAPRGRPRVDPAKAYFRHLRSYRSSEGGGIVGRPQRTAAA